MTRSLHVQGGYDLGAARGRQALVAMNTELTPVWSVHEDPPGRAMTSICAQPAALAAQLRAVPVEI